MGPTLADAGAVFADPSAYADRRDQEQGRLLRTLIHMDERFKVVLLSRGDPNERPLKHDGFSNAIVYGVFPAAAPLLVVGATLGGMAAANETGGAWLWRSQW